MVKKNASVADGWRRTLLLSAALSSLALAACTLPDVEVRPGRKPNPVGTAGSDATGGRGGDSSSSDGPREPRDAAMPDADTEMMGHDNRPTDPPSAGKKAPPEVAGNGGTAADVKTGAGGAGGSTQMAHSDDDAGTPPSTDPTVASERCAKNVCATEYPCQPRGQGYTCRGQYPDWSPTYATSAFVVNQDKTVTDTRSGLIWQQELPYIYTGCTAVLSNDGTTGEACLEDQAARYCAQLYLAGGMWRLPTTAELASLIDDSRFNPAIDETVFPRTPGGHFWSAPSKNGMNVDFRNGMVHVGSANKYVRCVKSPAPVVAAGGGEGAPPGRYSPFPTSTVRDFQTHLEWERNLSPGAYGPAEAAQYCAGLALEGGGWRLPSRAELLSIVDPTRSLPAIDPEAFPSTPNGEETGIQTAAFWTSTPSAESMKSTGCWYVDFGHGFTADDCDGTRVRCVRDFPAK